MQCLGDLWGLRLAATSSVQVFSAVPSQMHGVSTQKMRRLLKYAVLLSRQLNTFPQELCTLRFWNIANFDLQENVTNKKALLTKMESSSSSNNSLGTWLVWMLLYRAFKVRSDGSFLKRASELAVPPRADTPGSKLGRLLRVMDKCSCNEHLLHYLKKLLSTTTPSSTRHRKSAASKYPQATGYLNQTLEK